MVEEEKRLLVALVGEGAAVVEEELPVAEEEVGEEGAEVPTAVVVQE